MDPITHALSGMAGSLCLPSNTKRQHLYCIIAASLPDIDNLAFLWGQEAYMIHHRGFCHSFIGGFFLAAILVLISRLIDQKYSWKNLFLFTYTLICLHLFLDVITSYGTQLLLPFTHYRYSMPSVFIIDFLLTGSLIIGVSCVFIYPKKRKEIAAIIIAFLLIYPGFCKAIQFIQLERTKTVLSKEIHHKDHINVLPALFAPIYWKVIIEKKNCYEMRHLSIFSDINLVEAYTFEKADLEAIIEQSPDISFIKTFSWFVDYPAIKSHHMGHNKYMTIVDLKFVSVIPWLKELRDHNQMPFQLQLLFNQKNEIEKYFFGLKTVEVVQ